MEHFWTFVQIFHNLQALLFGTAVALQIVDEANVIVRDTRHYEWEHAYNRLGHPLLLRNRTDPRFSHCKNRKQEGRNFFQMVCGGSALRNNCTTGRYIESRTRCAAGVKEMSQMRRSHTPLSSCLRCMRFQFPFRVRGAST
jgi:hypothetical protein